MMFVKFILVATLETALNKYLALDTKANILLKPLIGKVIALKLRHPDWIIYFYPTTSNIQILESYQDKPDTVIKGSITTLAMMGMNANPMQAVFSGAVKIEGDIKTGEAFQRLFNQLNPDFVAKLSPYTGDVFAQKTGQLFHSSHVWGKETLNTMQLNISEFLQDETHHLPPQPEIDIFCDQVDVLRSDLDRLNERIKRLHQAT